MKRWLAILALALPAWSALPARAQDVRMAARDAVVLDVPGAIAVFAVDASTVETSVNAGQVLLRGRRAGDTVVTIVLAGSVQTLQVHVDPAAASGAVLEAARNQNRGVWEGRYDTGLHRFTSSLSANFGQGDRTAHLRVDALRQQATPFERGFTALPFASLELQSPGRSIVFLDQLIRSTALTMDGVALRGVHLREGEVEVHAGLAATTWMEDLLVPRNADRAASVALHLQRGPLRVVPSVVWLPDAGTSVPGVAALAVEGGQEADPLHYRAEVGYGGRLGGSFDVDYRSGETQGWLRGVLRPAGFAAPRAGRAAGNALDGAWSQRIAKDTLLSVNGSASRVNVGDARPTAAATGVELRQDIAPHWSTTVAAAAGMYRPAHGDKVTRSTVSLGSAYEGSNFGASALLRRQTVSLADRPGNGARFTLRGSAGGFRASAFVDAQEQATTLDLLLRGDPEIRRAVTELGIAASSPEEVVRQLRDNSALLVSRGVMIGALRMSPLRVQAGLDVSWRGDGPARPELGMRLVDDRAQGVAAAHRAFVGTLYANWRVSSDTEFGIGWSRWMHRRDGQRGDANSSFQLMARTRFDALPVPGEGHRAIVGRVMRNDAADSAGGSASAAVVPAAGVDVVLDRGRRTRTDAAGRFTFDNPGPGAHRVEAVLPPQPGVYFTSPSMQTVQAGGDASFSLNYSGARLSGSVRNDAGQPIPGVTVRVEGPSTGTAITDSSGVYRLGSPPGNARIFVVAETLPPGYEVLNLPPRSRALTHSDPAVVNFVVRAMRSVEGVASCPAGAPARVSVAEVSRQAAPDEKGRFVLRRLPAGRLTLVVSCPGMEFEHGIEIAAEPGIVRGLRLSPPKGSGSPAG